MSKEAEINKELIKVLKEKMQLLEEQKVNSQKIINAQKEQLILSGVMHPLPDANKLYKMAETIVSKQVVIFNTPENKQIDWEELKNDWFDWLNEEIKGNYG